LINKQSDVKPENFVFSENDFNYPLILIDFGFSQYCDEANNEKLFKLNLTPPYAGFFFFFHFFIIFNL
jgi:serine/threonine protein kinase